MNARILMALGLAALLASACDEKVEVPDGGTDGIDGAVDAGEGLDSGHADDDGGAPDGGPTCGDGVVQAPEICDGDCPTSCDDGAACTTDELTGSADECTAACTFAEITSCANGDGCCPAGCDATNDDDCSATCGNGVVEAPEVCDGDCPTSCDDGLACTTDTLVGSADSCSAECSATPITACVHGDGCCAPGCDATDDDDCLGPVVTGVSPTSVAIGSPLQVMGAALGGATDVTVGGVSQAFTASAAGLEIATIDETTPVGAAKDVVVTTPDGTSAAVTVDVLDRLAVVSATPVDATTVEVTFSRELDAASVEAGDFSIPGLTVSAASAAGAVVTLTTSAHAYDTDYTVTAADVTDTFGNGLTGNASAMFAGPTLGPVNLTDFASGVTQTNHPYTAATPPVPNGVYGTWYDAVHNAFSTPSSSTLESMPAMRIDDSGFANGVYAIFDGVVPVTGNYRVEIRVHVVEHANYLNGVRAFQVGVATGTGAVHRALPDAEGKSALAGVTITGDYVTMTTGDDTALGPITVTSATFAATAGDDVLIAFSTDVASGSWNGSSGWWSGQTDMGTTIPGQSYVLVGDVILVPVP